MKNTALVLGGSGGIGKVIVDRLAKQYQTVIVHYHQRKPKTNHPTIALDLSKPYEVKKVMQELKTQGYCIDTVVHAASPSIRYQKFKSVPFEKFTTHYQVAVVSFVAILQEIIVHMQQSRWGRIIAISSALSHNVPTSQLSYYISAKHALIGLCKALAVELAPYGVTVNSISPGVVDTPFLNTFPQQMKTLVAQKNPMKRLATPTDIAETVMFLCSSGTDYITGIDIPVAGGMVM